MGGLYNPLETMLYYLTLQFMSGYFPNNLKDIKEIVTGCYRLVTNLSPSLMFLAI